MSSQSPIRPDPMPLREALRGLRHVLRRGGETLAQTITVDALPGPAAGIAGAVLREVGGLAHQVDRVASGLAKSMLGGNDPGVANLTDLGHARDGDARFAEAVYVALRSVLKRLGAPGAFVSEAAARKVYAQAGTTTAAVLTLDLLAARVLRDAAAEDTARVPPSELEPVAIFAVLLWLQSARSEAENEAALDAATDLAIAIAPDVAQACATGDAGRLTTLFDKYAAHV